MAVTRRQRTIPPSMFIDEELVELPTEVRFTGIALRFRADDYGRAAANPILGKADVYPLTPETSHEEIDDHLIALEDVGYITLYVVEGKTYFQIMDWPKVDRPGPSNTPPPPDQTSVTPVTANSREPLVVGGKEGRKGEGEEGMGVTGVGQQGVSAGAPRSLADLAGTSEPSPFCQRHPIGTEDKCGPCGGARKRHEVWTRSQVGDEEDLVEEEAA